MWVNCSGLHDSPIIYYEFHESRASESAEEFPQGLYGVSTDYAIYHRLASEITLVGCLAHIKRKFTDAIKALSSEEQKTTTCYRGQEYCEALFHIEKKYRDDPPKDSLEKRPTFLKPVIMRFWRG